MRHRPRPREFENIGVSNKIRADIGGRIVEAVAHPRLCPQMYDPVDRRVSQRGAKRIRIGKVEPMEAEVSPFCRNHREPRLLQLRIVISIEIINPDHRIAARKQGAGDVHADEAGASGDENGHMAAASPRLAGRCRDRQGRYG